MVGTLYAQSDKGTLMGSLESNNIYYVKDNKLDPSSSANPDDHFGSNSYLKLDYTKGRFSAGVQLEGFLPPLTEMVSVLYWEVNTYSGKTIISDSV